MIIAGSIYSIIHNIFAKTNSFLVSGVAHLHGTYELEKLAGFMKELCWALVSYFTLSLGEVPSVSGLRQIDSRPGSVESEQYAIVAIALAVGLMTLFLITKIWLEAFWKAPPASTPATAQLKALRSDATYYPLLSPVVLLALMTIAIGLAAQAMLVLASRAVEQFWIQANTSSRSPKNASIMLNQLMRLSLTYFAAQSLLTSQEH
jgi:multicomponent Na+:H+ antiporter subunit D